mgnify:CR=1 FL=1
MAESGHRSDEGSLAGTATVTTMAVGKQMEDQSEGDGSKTALTSWRLAVSAPVAAHMAKWLAARAARWRAAELMARSHGRQRLRSVLRAWAAEAASAAPFSQARATAAEEMANERIVRRARLALLDWKELATSPRWSAKARRAAHQRRVERVTIVGDRPA